MEGQAMLTAAVGMERTNSMKKVTLEDMEGVVAAEQPVSLKQDFDVDVKKDKTRMSTLWLKWLVELSSELFLEMQTKVKGAEQMKLVDELKCSKCGDRQGMDMRAKDADGWS